MFIKSSARRLPIVLAFVGLVTASPGRADERPGLLATYTVGETTVERIDHGIQFRWHGARPDERLPAGPFSVRWQGLLFVPQAGKHQFHAYHRGAFDVRVDGKVVTQGQREESGWTDSEPVDLSFGSHQLEITFQSMGSNAEMGLDWSSEQFEREPIPVLGLTHQVPADQEAPFDIRTAVAQLRCAGCHESGTALSSPSLAHWKDAGNDAWTVGWLLGEQSNLRHPRFDLTPADAADIVAFLNQQAMAIKVEELPDGNASEGQELFESVGCLACHRIDDVGATGLTAAGDLTHIADKRSNAFLATWLTEPARWNADHRMPTFELTFRENANLFAYLSSLSKKNDTEPPEEGNADHGKQLVEKLGCAQCHQINGASARPRTMIHWTEADGNDCLGEPSPEGHRPGYQLPSELRDQVVAYLRSVVPSEAPVSADRMGQHLIAVNRCTGCHARGQEDGLRDVIIELGEVDPRAVSVRVAPSLNGVGDKYERTWLTKSVEGRATRLRPWLTPRMPSFPFRDDESRLVVDALIDQDRMPTFDRPAAPHYTPAEELQSAQRLVGPAGFGCSSCHQVGDFMPIVPEPSARGPNLAMIEERVRFDWYRRWTRNPSRMVRGVEMPAINLPSPGVVDGTIETQLAVLWNGLNRPSFRVPPPSAVRSLTALGRDRPIVFRDLFEHADKDWSTQPFGVGFPNGHNLLVDLDTFRIRRWWFGDFAVEQTRGKTWFWQTAGTTLQDRPDAKGLIAGITLGDGPLVEPEFVDATLFPLRGWQQEGDQVVMSFAVRYPELGFRECSARFEPVAAGVRMTLSLPQREGERWRLNLPADRNVTTPLGQANLSIDGAVEDSSSANATFSAMAPEVALTWTLEAPVEPISTLRELPPAPRPEEKTFEVLPGYEVVRLSLDDGPMPTGLAMDADGSMLVTSLKGGVHRLKDTDNDGAFDSYTTLLEALASPFGVITDGGGPLVIHKHELLRLIDEDGDDHIERTEVVSTGWGVTEDYHDWTVGPVPTGDGQYYLASSCQQDRRSPRSAIARGKLLRTLPGGGFEIVADGLRFPMGLVQNAKGDLFSSDNQGVTNPFNEINHLRPGRHYGFFSALEKRDKNRPVEPPAIQIPHPWTGSVNGLAFVPSGDAFGPYAGHLIGAEYTTRRLIRMSLQPVGDTYQGATYAFGEADQGTIERDETFLGPIALCFAPDGSLYVGSIIDSGWGGGNNRGAIERVRYRGQPVAGVREIRAWSGGFDIDFTTPVDPAIASETSRYTLSRYRRIHTIGYATPDRDRESVPIRSVSCDQDGRSVRIAIDTKWKEGFVYDIAVDPRISPGSETFYPESGSYTVRSIVGLPD